MAGQTAALTSAPRTQPRAKSRRARSENLAGWLWSSPWIIGFFLWTFGPMVYSFYLAFTHYNIAVPPQWTGLENFRHALTGQDSLFLPSLLRTFTWAIVMVPVQLTCSLLLAVLLNQKLKGARVFRTLFFLPSLTPLVALAVIWKWLYQPDFGAINFLLGKIGVVHPPLWFSDEHWAMPSLMIMTLWGAVGGSTMIIFLAGLQGVPEELYEAAAMDGAGTVSRFFNVTLPLITPTLFFNLVLGVIAALKTFTTAFVATNGGPHYATWFYILHFYQTAFQNFDMGYASTLAWIFFLIVVTLTILNVRFSRSWVYYEGEER